MKRLTIGRLRAELVGWPDDTPVTVAVPDREQPSIAAVLPIVSAGYGFGIEVGEDPMPTVSFPLTAEHHREAAQDVDPWGVPDRMLGPMPEAFYGTVGRIVTLSALLEDRLRALLQAITHTSQVEYARLAPGRFIPELQKHAALLGADWEPFADYLTRVYAALGRRNELVHSLWQAKDDHFFGHRLDRTPQRASTTRTLPELRADIADLIRLVDDWQHWHMVAGTLPWPDDAGPTNV